MVRLPRTSDPCVRCVIGPQAQASEGASKRIRPAIRSELMTRNRTSPTAAPQEVVDGPLDYLRAHVEYQQSAGVAWFPRSSASTSTPAAQAAAAAAPPTASNVLPPTPVKAASSSDLFASRTVQSA